MQSIWHTHLEIQFQFVAIYSIFLSFIKERKDTITSFIQEISLSNIYLNRLVPDWSYSQYIAHDSSSCLPAIVLSILLTIERMKRQDKDQYLIGNLQWIFSCSLMELMWKESFCLFFLSLASGVGLVNCPATPAWSIGESLKYFVWFWLNCSTVFSAWRYLLVLVSLTYLVTW